MILRRLSMDQLQNFGEHSESGKFTIEKWVQSYTNHPTDHAQQILKALGK